MKKTVRSDDGENGEENKSHIISETEISLWTGFGRFKELSELETSSDETQSSKKDRNTFFTIVQMLEKIIFSLIIVFLPHSTKFLVTGVTISIYFFTFMFACLLSIKDGEA